MAVDASIDIGTLIVATPGVVGGSPRIAGTRISVKHIAECFNAGLSAESMVERFPTIDLKGAYAAITYYVANRTEVDEDIAAEQATIDAIVAEHPEVSVSPS